MQDQLTAAVTELMREAFEGAQHDWTWFVDNEANHGILGTLDSVTAEQASRSFDGAKPSLAAHAGHLLFSIRVANQYAAGEEPEVDWDESWKDQIVSPERWDEIKTELRSEYEKLISQVPNIDNADQETMTGTIAAVAHVAYHLGAMRQLAPWSVVQ